MSQSSDMISLSSKHLYQKHAQNTIRQSTHEDKNHREEVPEIGGSHSGAVPAKSLFTKQLQIQFHYNLPRINFMQRQVFRDRSFGLTSFVQDVVDPDFRTSEEICKKRKLQSCKDFATGVTDGLTVGCKEVSVVDCYAQDVLLEVFDGELHRGIPFGVEGVVNHFGPMFLRSHADLTVWVTLPCKGQNASCDYAQETSQAEWQNL